MARTTKNFADKIRSTLARDADLAEIVKEERFNINVGGEICRARIKAGLTQEELAERIGTHQPVVARMESSDYDGHSLKMLRRIAEALDRSVRVTFVDESSSDRLTLAKFLDLPTPSDQPGEWEPHLTTAYSIGRM